MKRFTHGNFTEAFIASVGSMTGIVKDTLELTEICRWYSLKITLISSIFICGYFSFYTFYYLKSITFKNVYLFWHLAKSKLSLWVSLEKKKKTQHGDLAQRLKPLNPSRYTDCVRALSLQTHECPSPNSVSIASTQHSL